MKLYCVDDNRNNYDGILLLKLCIYNGLRSSQKVFGRPTSLYEVESTMAIIKYLRRSCAVKNEC